MPVPARTGNITTIVISVGAGGKRVDRQVMTRSLRNEVSLWCHIGGDAISMSSRCRNRWCCFCDGVLGGGPFANVSVTVVDSVLIRNFPQVPRRGRQQTSPQSA